MPRIFIASSVIYKAAAFGSGAYMALVITQNGVYIADMASSGCHGNCSSSHAGSFYI
jgi:hypothetical protein